MNKILWIHTYVESWYPSHCGASLPCTTTCVHPHTLCQGDILCVTHCYEIREVEGDVRIGKGTARRTMVANFVHVSTARPPSPRWVSAIRRHQWQWRRTQTSGTNQKNTHISYLRLLAIWPDVYNSCWSWYMQTNFYRTILDEVLPTHRRWCIFLVVFELEWGWEGDNVILRGCCLWNLDSELYLFLEVCHRSGGLLFLSNWHLRVSRALMYFRL